MVLPYALRVLDLESEKTLHTLEGHTGAVRAVAITPDGFRVPSALDDETPSKWKFHALALTPDGRRVVSTLDDETLWVWNLESGQTVRTHEGHTEPVNVMALTPDGRRAI